MVNGETEKRSAPISDTEDNNQSLIKRSKQESDSEIIILQKPRKSPSDSKEYRAIKLGNGLVALLISDAVEDLNPDWSFSSYYETDNILDDIRKIFIPSECTLNSGKETVVSLKNDREMQKNANTFARAAITVAVKAGSVNDPRDHQGLAHMLEHMIFNGSEKYPDENHFDLFVNYHGESPNGYNGQTEQERSMYYVQMNPEKLEYGLDIIQDMLLHPLLNEECALREMENVESEFLLHRHLLYAQILEIIKMTTIEDHPVGYFDCGTVQTIQKNGIREQLKKFHAQYYTTDNMVLVVESPNTLDSLQTLVEKYWGKIEKQEDAQSCENKLEHEKNPFDASKFGKLYKLPTQINAILMLWNVPPEAWQNTETKPMEFLSFILSDAREGSLTHFFIEKQWATSVSAGEFLDKNYMSKYHSLFFVLVELLEDGFENIEKVVQSVYDYLSNFLHQDALQKKTELWSEMKELRKNMFDYEGRGIPLDTTKNAAMLLLDDPVSTENMFTRSLITTEYKDDMFQKYVSEIRLHPENALYIQSAPRDKLGPTQKLKYCETVYSVENIPSSFLAEVKYPELILANLAANPWLSTSFPIFPTVDDLNTVIYPNMYVKYSNKVTLPRALWEFHITSGMKLDGISSVLLSLWTQYMRLKLNSTIVTAARAGIRIDLKNDSTGKIIVKISGFPQKIAKVCNEITSEIFTKDELWEEYCYCALQVILKNYEIEICNNASVFRECVEELLILNPIYIDSKVNIENITIDEVETFIDTYQEQFFIDGWISGNSSINEAIQFSRHLKALTRELEIIPQYKLRKLRVQSLLLLLPSSRDFCYRVHNLANTVDDNNYIYNYYQLPRQTPENLKFSRIIIALMGPYAFHQLRTVSHLGYVVGVEQPYPVLKRAVICLSIVSPSSKFSVCELSRKMDEFMQNFLDHHLNKIKEDDFTAFINDFQKRPYSKSIFATSPEPVTLTATKNWYRDKIVKCLPANNSGEFYGLSKLSIQLLGNPKEKCENNLHCNNFSWKTLIEGDQTIQFGAPDSVCKETSLERSGQKFFIWNVKEFHDNNINDN